MENNEAFRRGVVALLEHTGRLDTYISGDSSRGARRAILTAILGRKVKASECGTNALRAALVGEGNAFGNYCIAEQEERFQVAAKDVLLAAFPDLRLVVRTKREYTGEPRTVVDSYLVPAAFAEAEARRSDFGIYRHGLSTVAVNRGDAVEFDGEFTIRKVNA